MTTLRLHVSAAMALCRRDLLIYVSYRGRIAAQVLGTVVTLAMFYYIARLVTVPEFAKPATYFSYVVVGIVLVQTLKSAADVALNLHSELLAGTFERLVCSPFGAVNGIASSVIFPVFSQLAFAVLTVGIGGMLFGMSISWSTAPMAIPVALAAAVLFSGLALLGAAAVLVAKQTSSITAFATVALGLLGGVYFPIALLPWWARWIATAQPLTDLVDLMRHYLIGYQSHASLVGAGLRVLGFVTITLPLSYFALAQAVRFTRRRATVLEY